MFVRYSKSKTIESDDMYRYAACLINRIAKCAKSMRIFTAGGMNFFSLSARILSACIFSKFFQQDQQNVICRNPWSIFVSRTWMDDKSNAAITSFSVTSCVIRVRIVFPPALVANWSVGVENTKRLSDTVRSQKPSLRNLLAPLLEFTQKPSRRKIVQSRREKTRDKVREWRKEG